MTNHSPTSFSYRPYIDSALATPGGHLSIGRGGFTLYYGEGARLSGYDLETVKAECIAAGLPVIDSLGVPFDAVLCWADDRSGPSPRSRALACAVLRLAQRGRRRLCRGRCRGLEPAGDRHSVRARHRGERVMSRPLLSLHTTMREFEGLHERYDRTRSTSKTVTVEREALIHLLMDHSRWSRRCAGRGRSRSRTAIDPGGLGWHWFS